MSAKWIPTFLRAVGEAMVRRETYLVTPMGGGISCKACGCVIRGESLSKHYETHMREVDQHLVELKEAQAHERLIARKSKQEETSVEGETRGVGFYSTPCEACGKPISRTGKRGRPSRIHGDCKPPNSVQTTAEYTPEEQALLEELGL